MATAIEFLIRGTEAFGRGDHREAQDLYQAAVDLEPDSASGHNNLGFVLAQQQRWAEALVHLRTALRLDPSSSMAHVNLGQVLAATGELDDGISHMERATECDPTNDVAWDNLSRLRLMAGRTQQAEYAAMRAAKLRPTEPKYFLRLGTAIMVDGRPTEAIPYFRRSLMADGTMTEAWVQLGLACMLNNDWGSARDALEAALRWTPDDFRIHRHLGMVMLKLNDRDGAVRCFERSLVDQSTDDPLRLELAILYLSLGRYEDAHTEMAKLDAETSATARARYYGGVTLHLLGHHEKAKTIFSEVWNSGDPDYGLRAASFCESTGAIT